MANKTFLGHRTAIAQATITRPNDTTPYTAGDVIGDAVKLSQILDFPSCAAAKGAAGMISTACLIDSANQATAPALELWLFSVAPAAQTDNQPFAVTDAEMANFIGVVPLSVARIGNTGAAALGNLIIQSDVATLAFVCAGGSADLFGIAVVRNPYTPVANEVFTFKLSNLQDFAGP